MSDFSKCVKIAMLKHEVSLQELSEKLGVTRQTIYNTLKINKPNSDTWVRYSDAFGVTEDQLRELEK